MLFKLASCALFAASSTLAMSPPNYPPGCSEATYPDENVCKEKNFFLGTDAKDKCAPLGPVPVSGEQVFIQDAANFCLNLPDPDSPYLKNFVYAGGRLPTILDGEGHVRSFCMGSYLTPGALPMPAGGIRSAHVIKGVSKNGKKYIQISGTMDCAALGINCTASAPDAYDDGGQYDTAPFINCGKEPYSGVDASKHPGMPEYVEQAGNGLFCMRVCEAGTQQNDPCNVKDDTKGCQYTMGITTFNTPGFDVFDQSTGQTQTFSVSLPPLKSTTSSATTKTATATGASATTTSAKNSADSVFSADSIQSLASLVAGVAALIL